MALTKRAENDKPITMYPKDFDAFSFYILDIYISLPTSCETLIQSGSGGYGYGDWSFPRIQRHKKMFILRGNQKNKK